MWLVKESSVGEVIPLQIRLAKAQRAQRNKDTSAEMKIEEKMPSQVKRKILWLRHQVKARSESSNQS